MIQKTALITGIRGQDAAFLAKFLLDKGYKVIGTDRRNSNSSHWRLEYLQINNHPSLIYEYMDITEFYNVQTVIKKYQPDEIYNLAAMSFVQTSFNQPFLTNKVNTEGVLNILEAIKHCSPNSKLYQASTSEMFGRVLETPQKETTPFNPRSPYGIAKLAAHEYVKNYRESYGLFACSGILFNHTGQLRGTEFVTRKITSNLSNILLDIQECIELGNLYAKRDWGYAGDYVEAMWLMLQQPIPDDFVIATGETHTIKEFVDEAFNCVDMPLSWVNEGINEQGIDSYGIIRVKINPIFYRPNEVDILQGDATKAKEILKWQPKMTFKKLVEIMVEYDCEW